MPTLRKVYISIMLLSVGKPMIDIIVKVDDNLLNKYGLKPNDAGKATEDQAELFKDILKLSPKYVPGSSVTNTLRVFQWASGYERKAFLIGVIGKDHFGVQIKNQLEKEKIENRLIENSVETVQCAVLISNNGKNRSLLTNSNLKSTQIVRSINFTLDEFEEQLTQCRCFYVPAFSLVLFSNLIKEITEYCILNKKKIVINLGATYILEKCSDDAKYLLEHADVVIGNEEEYRTLAKLLNVSAVDLQTVFQLIINSSNIRKEKESIFVVTRGDDDIICYNNGNVTDYKVSPVQQVVDTTGAGDAFAGGFLVQYMNNSSLEHCIQCGIECASHVIQYFGCDFDMNLDHTRLFKFNT